MNRRNALKNIGYAAGLFVATPTVLSMLQSCNAEVETWIPEFLTQDQGKVLVQLSDIILPKTETLPSAKALNIPQFIDQYYNAVLDDENQAHTKFAFKRLLNDVQPNKETKVEDITRATYTTMLDKYMLLKGEIDTEREANPEALQPTRSEFLNALKYLLASAYTHTEDIGKHVLVYDPVPTQYYCGDAEELTGGLSYAPNNGLF